jgi:hypothetical protein
MTFADITTCCDHAASGQSGGSPPGTNVASPMILGPNGKNVTFQNITAGTAAYVSGYNTGIYGPYSWNSYAGGFIFNGQNAQPVNVWEIKNLTDNETFKFEVISVQTPNSAPSNKLLGFNLVRICGGLDFNITIETRIAGPPSTNGSLANGYLNQTRQYGSRTVDGHECLHQRPSELGQRCEF